MKRFDTFRHAALGVLCSLTMVVSGLAPMAVQAAAPSSIKIGATELIDESNKEQDAEGADYYSLENGTITYKDGVLTLNGANISVDADNTDGIQVIGDVTINLVNDNAISNGRAYNDVNDGIQVTGALTITGSGSLTVNANCDTGIVANKVTVAGELDDNGDVKYAPTVVVKANGQYGVGGVAGVTVENGASLTVDGYGDKADTANYYATAGIVTTGCRAHVTVNNATLNVKGYSYGVITQGCGSLIIGDSVVEIQSMNVVADPGHDGEYKNADGTYAVSLGSDTTTNHTNRDGAAATSYGRMTINNASETTIIGGVKSSATPPIFVTSSTLTSERMQDGVDKIELSVEYGDSRYEKDATLAVDSSGNTSPFAVTTLNGYKSIWFDGSSKYYIHTKDSMINRVKASTWTEGHHCNHVYEWEVYQQATATNDGIMRYRCKYCGDVQYEVPVTAYYMFNKNTQEAILKAEQGATVTTETALFISFHDMVQKALEQRPDVTLVVDYRNAGKNYEMTIPAGSAEQLNTLFGDSQFAGFLYLGGTYATTELPEDWTFSTVPASVVWFGANNAH